MSVILDKNKKFEKQKIKRFTNLKKNIKISQEKYNAQTKSTNSKPPRQKSFVLNGKGKKKKFNNINYTTDFGADIDDINDLFPNGNDPFSRSVIYSNNKRPNNLFTSLKGKKYNEISLKKNQKSKILNNKEERNINNSRHKYGSGRIIKNSNAKSNSNVYNNLNISADFNRVSDITKFEEIEEKIIDKNYENDIDNDEMIIGNNKNKKNKSQINTLFNKIKMSSNNIHSNLDNNEFETYFNNNTINEEYNINNSFENNKADFFIMYIDNYQKMINDDMLLLELQLLFEKILDLQNEYHKEYNKLINKFITNKKFISIILYKYKEIQKKIFNLEKIKDNINSKNELNNFLNILDEGC